MAAPCAGSGRWVALLLRALLLAFLEVGLRGVSLARELSLVPLRVFPLAFLLVPW